MWLPRVFIGRSSWLLADESRGNRFDVDSVVRTSTYAIRSHIRFWGYKHQKARTVLDRNAGGVQPKGFFPGTNEMPMGGLEPPT